MRIFITGAAGLIGGAIGLASWASSDRALAELGWTRRAAKIAIGDVFRIS
jgi:hypothetical protein